MTCSDSYPLSSVHLIKKWIILVTQDKFEILFSVMLWKPLWCILVNFGAFGCTPCVTLWPLHDLLSLLSSFKCPLNAKMDHISHSGQIRNTLLWHAMETTLVHFGLFWCTTWATPWPLCIEFSWSHQKYASYVSRALKCDQSYLLISISARYIDQTGAITMGKMDKRYHHLPCRKKSIFLKTAKGNVLLRPILDWHACLLRRSREKWWVTSQIAWQIHEWYVRGKADFHEIET